MTTEAKKRNTDYSASAVNLTNSKVVEELINKYSEVKKVAENLNEKAQALIPQEIKDNIELANYSLNELNRQIRDAVDQFGSYQDLEHGVYALKQRKMSKSYDAVSFEKIYPQFSPAVIIKAVDTTKLNGLVKGGLLDEARLEADGVLKISESFAYIIK